MEGSKKRKVDESSGYGKNAFNEEEIRLLIEPLAQPTLVDILVKLGSQHPSIAEEIKRIACADLVHRRLLVRGLAQHTTSETLHAAFEEHGEIEEASVIYDQETAESCGYGFITYKKMESAENALRAPTKIIDTNFPVCRLVCEKKSSIIPAPVWRRRVCIGKLSPEITFDMLINYFSMYGEIEEGAVAYDSDSTGFAFVTYKNLEAAKMAVKFPKKRLLGRNIIATAQCADYSCIAEPGLPSFPLTRVPMPELPKYVPKQKSQTVAPSAAPYRPAAICRGESSTAPAPYPSVAAAEEDQYGFPIQSVGINNYPYYYPKQ